MSERDGSSTAAGRLSANSMDEKRKEHIANEHLCHLEAANRVPNLRQKGEKVSEERPFSSIPKASSQPPDYYSMLWTDKLNKEVANKMRDEFLKRFNKKYAEPWTASVLQMEWLKSKLPPKKWSWVGDGQVTDWDLSLLLQILSSTCFISYNAVSVLQHIRSDYAHPTECKMNISKAKYDKELEEIDDAVNQILTNTGRDRKCHFPRRTNILQSSSSDREGETSGSESSRSGCSPRRNSRLQLSSSDREGEASESESSRSG